MLKIYQMTESELLLPLFLWWLCVYSLLKCASFSPPLQVESEFFNQKGCSTDVLNELKGHGKEMLVW